MKTWRIVLLAISAMLLAISTALLVTAATGSSWSDASGWIEALATTAGLGAAVAAAALIVRTLQLETERDEARFEFERRAQATLIAAWGIDVEYETAKNQDGYEVPAAITGAKLHLRNASQVPVTQLEIKVIVRYVLETEAGTDYGTESSGITLRDVLAPSADPVVDRVILESVIPLVAEGQAIEAYPVTLVQITFTDSAGARWCRTITGLTEVATFDRNFVAWRN